MTNQPKRETQRISPEQVDRIRAILLAEDDQAETTATETQETETQDTETVDETTDERDLRTDVSTLRQVITEVLTQHLQSEDTPSAPDDPESDTARGTEDPSGSQKEPKPRRRGYLR